MPMPERARSAGALRHLAALSLAATTAACSGVDAPPRPAAASLHATSSIVLLTGPSGGAYAPFGRALAAVYNQRLPDLHVNAETTSGPEGAASNARAVEEGRADLAFSRADIAYQILRPPVGSTQAPAAHLRSIAVLYTNAVHVLVSRASGITRGEDIRGHRIQMAEEGTTGGLALTRAVVEAYGLGEGDVTVVGNARNGLARLKSGDLDVRIFASAYPLAGIDDVGPTSPIALLSLTPAAIDRLRSRSPFFKPAVIPRGTYAGQAEDVRTVGIDGLLLCRDSMPETVVHDLTQALFEALTDLARTEHSARLIDTVNAPATPVPLHPGAARYYRERDLFR